MRADDTPNRKISHRRVDMGHEVQPARTDPRTLDHDIRQVDRDELADFRAAIDAGDQLEIDLPSTAVTMKPPSLVTWVRPLAGVTSMPISR